MGSDYANEHWSRGKIKKKRDGNFSPSVLFFALPLAQSDSYTSPPPIARQILLPPFAFVFWISTANRCLQPEWLYFMSCKLAEGYSSATLSYRLSSSSSFSSSCLKPTSPWVQVWSCRATESVHFTVHYNRNLALNHTGTFSQHGSYPWVLSSWPTDWSTVWSLHMVCWHTVPTLYMST